MDELDAVDSIAGFVPSDSRMKLIIRPGPDDRWASSPARFLRSMGFVFLF